MRRRLVIILVLAVLILGSSGCGGSQSTHKEVPVTGWSELPAPSGGDYWAGPNNSGLQVHFIDVGQGDSVLVLTPDGEAMLVDGGDSDHGQTVVDYLRSQGVRKLAVLVATHPHADHIGGLAAVLNNFQVGRVYMPRVTNNTDHFAALLTAINQQGLKIKTAQAGGQIPLPGVEAVFLAPNRQGYENLNDYSAVIKLTYHETSVLLAGDASELSEDEMLAAGADLKADVLKIGHHGSHSSTGEEFLQTVGPRYAVIMCGAGNDYGHPHGETLERLSRAGVKVYRTDLNGSIVMKSDGEKIVVKTVGKKMNTVARKTAAANNPAERMGAGGSLYIGNRNSRKFHRATCSSLPEESNRVYFSSREEAIASGYTPCGRCHP